MFVSGWKPISEAPLLNSIVSLLKLSTAFCEFQAAKAADQLPHRVTSFLKSGQIVGQVSNAMANAKSGQERTRIKREYDAALENAKNMSLPVRKKEGSPPKKKGPISATPGGVAREPRKTPSPRPLVLVPSPDSFARRWKK